MAAAVSPLRTVDFPDSPGRSLLRVQKAEKDQWEEFLEFLDCFPSTPFTCLCPPAAVYLVWKPRLEKKPEDENTQGNLADGESLRRRHKPNRLRH